MPVDPRLNCAAEICCGPPPIVSGPGDFPVRAHNGPAHRARVAILVDLGVEEDHAHKVAGAMAQMGIVFLSSDLARAIREIAFPTAGEGESPTERTL